MAIRATAFFTLILSVLATGQDHGEFTAWMKSSDMSMKALDKLPAKAGAEAVREAERIAGVYENLIGFWRQRNAADAVKWSEQGKAAAVRLASAAHARRAAEAADAFKSLAATCQSCHDAHRIKLADGSFAFKPDRDPGQPRPSTKK
jgi:hypothetical protein